MISCSGVINFLRKEFLIYVRWLINCFRKNLGKRRNGQAGGADFSLKVSEFEESTVQEAIRNKSCFLF